MTDPKEKSASAAVPDAALPPPPLESTDYVPIACSLHSEYELAILHRRPLHLVWSENNVIHDEVVLPLDLETEHHEEFLVCRAKGGTTRRIRLDHIRRMKQT